VVQLSHDTYLNHLATAIIGQLICSPVSSAHGIHVTIEKLYNSAGELNVYRRSVLRQYFGLTHSTTDKEVRRYSYGTGAGISSVGIDITNFMTRELTPPMNELSIKLFEMLKCNRVKLNLENVDLSNTFNHCTVLMYYASDKIKKLSDLGKHCDCTFSVHNGKFIPSANSQAKNTVTVIYSLGGERELTWSRRRRENGHWQYDSWSTNYQLTKDTVTIIHPDDEDPELPLSSNVSYQYQHGCSGVKNDNFSIALVFRVVTSIRAYDLKTNIMIANTGQLSEADIRTYRRFSFHASEFHNNLLQLYYDHIMS